VLADGDVFWERHFSLLTRTQQAIMQGGGAKGGGWLLCCSCVCASCSKGTTAAALGAAPTVWMGIACCSAASCYRTPQHPQAQPPAQADSSTPTPTTADTTTTTAHCLCLLPPPTPPPPPLPQDVSPKYNALLNLVGRGSKTYGERLSECAAMDNLLLMRSKQEVIDMFPPSEQVSEGHSTHIRSNRGGQGRGARRPSLLASTGGFGGVQVNSWVAYKGFLSAVQGLPEYRVGVLACVDVVCWAHKVRLITHSHTGGGVTAGWLLVRTVVCQAPRADSVCVSGHAL